MEVGGPGVHTLPAAGLVVVVLRQNLDSAITLHPLMEDLIVKDHLLNPLSVALKLVQWTEVGDLGVPTLPAAGLVVEALRQNLDSVTTLPHQTEGSGVQDHLLKDQIVTLEPVL